MATWRPGQRHFLLGKPRTHVLRREGLGWEGRRRRDLGWDKGDIRGHVKDVGFGGP